MGFGVPDFQDYSFEWIGSGQQSLKIMTPNHTEHPPSLKIPLPSKCEVHATKRILLGTEVGRLLWIYNWKDLIGRKCHFMGKQWNHAAFPGFPFCYLSAKVINWEH